MYQKLQHNYDIIQYLVKDITSEQLEWRRDEAGWSLREIICHLRNVEILHYRSYTQPEIVTPFRTPATRFFGDTDASIEYAQEFETYSRYRRQTVAFLGKTPAEQWGLSVVHQLFGRVTLAELAAQIDAYDRAYIHQMETIIHQMPLNPLLSRAIREIREYQRRYQPYLRQATSLLDIGVGTGLALHHVMQQNPHLACFGVDIRDLRLPNVTVPLQVYDGYMLPFKDHHFDVSLLFYVLHHCEDPEKVLAEAVRVTRRHLLIIEEFNDPEADETSLDLTERQSHRALGLPPDLPFQLFDKAEFEAMLRANYLVELDRQPLPSKTTRPVQKYLYVMGLENDDE